MTLGGGAVGAGRRSGWYPASAPVGASTVAVARRRPARPTPPEIAVSPLRPISSLPCRRRRGGGRLPDHPPDPLVDVHARGAGLLLDAPLLRRLEVAQHLGHPRPPPAHAPP